MTNDKVIDIALKHVGDWTARSHKLAYAIQGLIEGDDPEEAAALLHKYGYTDEDGFWIYEEDE